ncbi:MAG: Ribosomal-protein-L7p-serine acetyltransferase [Acidimicrobiaceae bacterium]|nr:Ribosomal-protein-L7p-serine acetyltransferase [Acidimicrobiaceae bacterium]
MTAHPPDVIDAGRVVLRLFAQDDAERVAAAVTRNLKHLEPWMPWATEQAGTLGVQRELVEAAAEGRRKGTDYEYVALTHEGDLVGRFGLHRRVGPGAVELGYWLDADAVGHGFATAAAEALTRAALELDGVHRVEIHCDEANLRSRGVPTRLGYRLDRVEHDGVRAPAEVGRSMVWVYPPAG